MDAPVGSYPWQRPFGAQPVEDGQVEFRVWAPSRQSMTIRLGASEHEMEPVGFGVHETRLPAVSGDEYEYVIDGRALPDPCSRWQPSGFRGPSRIVDTRAFDWSDAAWSGIPQRDWVIYELHVGTCTEEGTFDAVVPRLAELRELGVTAIELMPVADAPGNRGWGYDGVYAFAPHEAYGGPHALHRLIDAAHGEGLAVILDVVYNHVGASGVPAMRSFGPYFTDRFGTFWGEALNYDGPDCDAVREWAIQNACYWVGDFHVDGLRLDAIHAIFDMGADHVLRQLRERVRQVNPRAFVIAESESNDPRVIRPPELGGHGFDAQWADEFHHALRTLLTGDRDGYYADFGRVCDLAKAYHRPFVHDGKYSRVRRRVFGAPADDRPPEQFVVFCQNHDQVGNRALGDRLPTESRALAAMCTLFSPFTPMLFMGEEYGETRPFLFFTDHVDAEIASATREGRRREFRAFSAFDEESIPDPQALETFESSKLARRVDARLRDLYRALIALRAELPPGDALVDFSEPARWLRVVRGPFEMIANFGDRSQSVSTPASEVVLRSREAVVESGSVWLSERSGAILR